MVDAYLLRDILMDDGVSIPFEGRTGSERGVLWKDYIIGERVKRGLNNKMVLNFYFWQTYSNQEIDLIEEGGQDIWAIEIRSGTKGHVCHAHFPKVILLPISLS